MGELPAPVAGSGEAATAGFATRRARAAGRGALILALAVLTATGGHARYRASTATGLWLDEILAITRSQADPLGLDRTSVLDGQHGPLYHAILSAAARVDPTERGYRLAFVLAGTAAIPGVFLLGAAVGGPAAGFVAAAMLAFSPIHVYCSAEARPAALLVLELTLGLLAAQALSRGRHRARWALLVSLTGAVLVLTSGQGSWYAAVLLLAFAVGLLASGLSWRGALGWLLAAAGLAAGLFLAAYGYYVSHGTDPITSPRVTLDLLARLFQPLVSGFSEDQAPTRVIWVGLIPAVAGGAWLLARPTARAVMVVLAAVAAFAVPLVPLYAVHWGVRVKYMMGALPALVVLQACAVAWAGRGLAALVPRRRAAVREATIAAVVAVSALGVFALQAAPTGAALAARPDWRQVAQVIQQHLRPGQLLLASNGWPVVSLGYYLRRLHVDPEFRSAGESIERAHQLLVGREDAILVAGGFHADPAIRRWMDQFVLLYASRAEAIRVYYYPDRLTYVTRGMPPGETAEDERRLHDTLGGRLAFDDRSARFLLDGWSGPERDPRGAAFRWASARRCRVYLPVFRRPISHVLLSARAYEGTGGPQAMSVSVNGQSQGVFPLPPGWTDIRVDVSGAPWRYGGNVLQLDFAAAARPADVVAGSADRRTLAAAFRSLVVE